MCLKIMEKGKPKDVAIKEGEIFVLPSFIPHSPQVNNKYIIQLFKNIYNY